MKTIYFLLLIPILLSAQNAGGIFSVGPNMNETRMGHNHVVLDNGDILLLGGHTTNFISMSTAEYFSNNTFVSLNMNYPHDSPALVKHANGLYYIFGGSDNLGIAPGFATVDVYNPATNTFSALPSTMNYGRMMAQGTMLSDGKILIVGGWYDYSSPMYGEIFDPATGTFTVTGALNTPRSNPIVVPTNDGKAYIFGGMGVYGTPYFENVEEYDPATNAFTAISDTILPDLPGLVMLNNWKVQDANKDYNGNYVYYCTETETGAIHLISFNPSTKTFEKIVLDKEITMPANFGVSAYTFNKTKDMIYLLATSYSYEASKVCLFAVNLRTNTLYEPNDYYTLPNTYIVGSVSMDMMNNGNILVAGGSTSNDYYYNFNPVANTIIIEPAVTKVTPINNNIPVSFNLSQNYPNPFNPSTKIAFSLNKEGNVNLKIYDVLGNEIAELINEYMSAGNYEIEFNPATKRLNLASGMYVYKLTQNGLSISKKMLLQK